MYFKIALNFILILLLVVLQFSFVSAMSSFYSGTNILLVAIIFILALFGTQVTWWWVLGIGSFYDVINYAPFGIYLISYIIVFFIVNFLQKNFFTNRSLYSFLALITFATLTYKIILYGGNSLLLIWSYDNNFNFFYKNFWLSEIYSLLLNICLVFIVYNIINFMSKRLKPTFLIKK